MANKKLSFREKMAMSREKDKSRESSYGYLNIPSNITVLKIGSTDKVHLDFLPYVVSDENHPDRVEDQLAVPGDLWWRRPFRIHRNIGPSNQTVVCPSTYGLPCPICEYRKKLFAEKADKELTDPLKLSYRYLYIVQPIGHEKFEESLHIWDISYTLFQKLLDQEVDEDESRMDFPSLEGGLTLDIRFTEEQLGKNKYYEASRIDFSEREDYEESILDEIPDLDKVLTLMTYKQLEALFLDFEEDDEEEEEEKPVRRKRNTAPPEVEEEVEEEEVVEEEVEKPVRKKRTTKKPEPEPEEEEEKTRKRKAAKKIEPKEKCPSGYKFGVDTDDHDECDTCNLWDTCIEKKEG